MEAKTTRTLRVRAENAFDRVAEWTRKNGVQLEHSKTEALLFAGRRRIPPLTLHLERHTCRTASMVKYLGVWLARSRSFREHTIVRQAGQGKPSTP